MLRYVKNGMLLLSLLFIVLGVLLLVMPQTSLCGSATPSAPWCCAPASCA